MSQKIFMRSSESLGALAGRVGELLHAQMEALLRQGEVFYWSNTPDFAIEVAAHEFVNDGPLLFETFPYFVEVSADSHEATARESRRVFEMLKALRLPMMLVEDLERKSAEFDPGA